MRYKHYQIQSLILSSIMLKNCKSNILKHFSDIRSLPQNQKSKECILILDEKTSHILSQLISMQEILQFGIKELCRADKKKRPDPSAVSIYYITCQSLQYMLKDFDTDDLYFSINLLLSGHADYQMMKSIANHTNTMQRLASFGQLYLPCTYFSNNMAKILNQTQKPNILKFLLSKNQNDAIVSYASELFKSLIASFQIDAGTSIKIYAYDSTFSNKVCEIIHRMLREHLQAENMQENNDKNILGVGKSSQLIIVLADREIDMIAPLVRSFYYLPAIMDFFEVSDSNPIKIVSNKLPPTQLQTDDPILNKYLHRHIYKAFSEIDQDFQNYVKKSKAAQFQKQKNANKNNQEKFGEEKPTHQLREIIRELPNYNKLVKSYQANIEIMGAIGKIKKERNLDQLSQLEHLIVTGVNGLKQVEKDKKILLKVWQELSRQKNPLTAEDKCRIILETVFCLDLPNDQKTKLIKLLSEQKTYGNLAVKLSTISRNGIKKYALTQNSDKSLKQFYVNRHHTIIANALEEIIVKEKVPKKFKLMQIGENQSKMVSKMKKFRIKPQVVVSMSGGIGYNQIVNCIQVLQTNNPNPQQKQQLLNFISDKYMSPSQYLKMLLMI